MAQISQDNALKYTDAASSPIEPPRLTNAVAKKVEMPDGVDSHGNPKTAESVRFDLTLTQGSQEYTGFYVVPAGTSAGEDERKTTSVEEAIRNLDAIHQRVMASDIDLNADDALVRIFDIMFAMDEERRAAFEGDPNDFVGLGAQATLAYQMAFWMAAAKLRRQEPFQYLRQVAPGVVAAQGKLRTRGLYNITNGGAHGGGNYIDFQEFMLWIKGETYGESIIMAEDVDTTLGLIYQALGLQAYVDDEGMGPLRGKEGGYSIPDLTQEKLKEIFADAGVLAGKHELRHLPLVDMAVKGNVGIHSFIFAVLVAAVMDAGYTVDYAKTAEGPSVQLASDGAASELAIKLDRNGRFTKSLERVQVKKGEAGFVDGVNLYRLKSGGVISEYALANRVVRGEFLYTFEGVIYTSRELSDFWVEMVNTYPIGSIEDAKDENDWKGLIDLIFKLKGKNVTIVVDDSTVTQEKRLRLFIEHLSNAGLIDRWTGKVVKDIKLAILIKLNQNGYLMTGRTSVGTGNQEGYAGTVEVMQIAESFGIESDVSHRSKEAGAEHRQGAIGQLAAAANTLALKAGDPIQLLRFNMHDELARMEEFVAAS
jgi:enolase